MIEELRKMLSILKPYVICSPPRSASTVVARCLHNHSSVFSYIHEPCGEYYHEKGGIVSIIENMKKRKPEPLSTLIKDISFQIGIEDVGKAFFEHATLPLIFLLRNPKLTVESKIRRICWDMINGNSLPDNEVSLLEDALEHHDYRHINAFFNYKYLTPEQTGWGHLYKQVLYCLENKIEFILFETDKMRAAPKEALTNLCESLGMKYEDTVINWKNEPFPDHGILPEQKWFSRISSSVTIQPPTEKAISLDNFPERLIRHIEKDIGLYKELADYPNNLI